MRISVEHREYIICPHKKGQPRKHVAVCRKCRHQAHCKAYQAYIQPPLPIFST